MRLDVEARRRGLLIVDVRRSSVAIARVPSSASWTAMPQLSSSMAVTTPP
jgi:hypothetical protein